MEVVIPKMLGRANLEIDFTGRIPSKKNSKQIFFNKKAGRRFVASSGEYSAWEKEHVEQCKKYAGMFKGKSVRVEINFVTGDRRAWDLTNKAEGILDVLVRSGIIDDDNVMVVRQVNLSFQAYDPGKFVAFVDIHEI